MLLEVGASVNRARGFSELLTGAGWRVEDGGAGSGSSRRCGANGNRVNKKRELPFINNAN